MAISMARAKALCNTSELAVVRSSSRSEIGKLSAAELRRAESRARKLRDKWRDQAAGQRRTSQKAAGTRDAAANRNSTEKAALFEEVLARFTARLQKLEAAGETAGPMGRARSTRSKRSQSHRASRAAARGELAESKRELKTKSKNKAVTTGSPGPSTQKPKSKTSKPVSAESEPEAAAKEGEITTPAKPAKQPKKSGKPFGSDMTGLEAGRKAQGLRVTKKGQLLAATAAKQDRLKASGMVRIQTNRSAANRRQQGRRDSR